MSERNNLSFGKDNFLLILKCAIKAVKIWRRRCHRLADRARRTTPAVARLWRSQVRLPDATAVTKARLSAGLLLNLGAACDSSWILEQAKRNHPPTSRNPR